MILKAESVENVLFCMVVPSHNTHVPPSRNFAPTVHFAEIHIDVYFLEHNV